MFNVILQELYEIVESHLPKAVPEADKENGGGEMEVDREEGVRQIELQLGILNSLGLVSLLIITPINGFLNLTGLARDQGDTRAVPSNHGEACKFPTYCDISPPG